MQLVRRAGRGRGRARLATRYFCAMKEQYTKVRRGLVRIVQYCTCSRRLGGSHSFATCCSFTVAGSGGSVSFTTSVGIVSDVPARPNPLVIVIVLLVVHVRRLTLRVRVRGTTDSGSEQELYPSSAEDIVSLIRHRVIITLIPKNAPKKRPFAPAAAEKSSSCATGTVSSY